MKDFIIRQLYYPYKVWKSNTNKEIIPIMLIKHDNIFNFFVYSFENENDYNSIKLKEIKRYILDEPYNPIEVPDIINIMSDIQFVKENSNPPFPQANTFNIVLDLLEQLNDQEMTPEDITNFLEYDPRQTNYYIDAAIYLGFVRKEKKYYTLTEYGNQIMKMNHKNRTLEIVKSILSHKPFYIAMKQQIENFSFDKEEIAKTIFECRDEINEETAKRRTSSVIAWIRWILEISNKMN